MSQNGVFPPGSDVETIFEFYIQACSVEVDVTTSVLACASTFIDDSNKASDGCVELRSQWYHCYGVSPMMFLLHDSYFSTSHLH